MPFGLSAVAVKAIGIGLLVLALLGALAGVVHHLKHEGATEVIAAAAAQHSKDVDAARAQEARIAADQSEAAHEADKFNSLAARGAEHAVRAGDSVQHRFDAINARCVPSDTAASAPGQAASDAADLRADVFRRLREAAGQFAATADHAHGAGQLAADSYDALTPGTP
jgi:hypothetical protein